MPPPSQSGPPNRPSSPPLSPPRRLRSPAERFGPPPPEPEALLTPPDAGATAPQARPSETARPLTRYERRRFLRENRRVNPRGRARGTGQGRKGENAQGSAASGTSNASAETPPPPALLRVQAACKRFWRRFRAILGALCLAGAGAAALFAPAFNIEAISISGMRATPPSQVRSLVTRWIGHNIFRAPKTSVVRAVEKLPTVASARVVFQAKWPPRLELAIREREPTLRINDGTSEWVADAGGTPFRVANADDKRLPAIAWASPVRAMRRFGASQWSDAVRLASAVKAAPQSAFSGGWKLREMRLDTGGDATLALTNSSDAPPLRVRLGNDAWPEKVARARVALDYFARTGRHPQELDLISLHLPRWTARPVSLTPDLDNARGEVGERSG